MGQSVLITGSSSGFGRAISEALARHGHTVFASMRDVGGKNAAAAAELTTWAQNENLSLHVIEMDVTDDASVQAGVQQVIDQTGHLDAVINNAGTMVVGLSEACTLDQFRSMYEVNVFGALRVNQAVLPIMRQQKSGYLIYLSSSGASLVYPFMGMYGSSKAALQAMAETLHYEVYSLGIDTTIIQAGMYATNLGNNFQPTANEAVWSSYGPVGQIAQGYTQAFPQALAPGNAPGPEPVAELIADLLQKPSEARPLKTTLGMYTEGVVAFHQATMPIQEQVVPALGLGMLLERATDA